MLTGFWGFMPPKTWEQVIWVTSPHHIKPVSKLWYLCYMFPHLKPVSKLFVLHAPKHFLLKHFLFWIKHKGIWFQFSCQILIFFKYICLIHRWQWMPAPYFPVFRNRSLTARCCLMSYTQHPFFRDTTCGY